MRILFVHEVNYSSKVIFEMHEFPELLALVGHDVSFFHFPEGSPQRHFSLKTARVKIVGRAYPDARITLVTPPTFGGATFERYIAPILNAPSLRREIRSGNYDVVVLYSVPTTGWQTIHFAKSAKVPVVFRALDVSHMIRKNALAPLIRAAEKYIYRNADLVSANNAAMGKYCVEISGRSGPTRVNLPPLDLAHFAVEHDGSLRGELGLGAENKVILYMGSFFSFSGLDSVISDLVPHFAQHPTLRLVLVGGGDLDSVLREQVERLGLADRVIFTGVVPYAELPRYLATADVAINPFHPELLTNVALPHKVLQYMAAGIPTVSTSLEGLRGVLEEASGVTWVPGSHDVAAAATELVYRVPAVLNEIGQTERDTVASRFSTQSAVTSFEETLRSVF